MRPACQVADAKKDKVISGNSDREIKPNPPKSKGE